MTSVSFEATLFIHDNSVITLCLFTDTQLMLNIPPLVRPKKNLVFSSAILETSDQHNGDRKYKIGKELL